MRFEFATATRIIFGAGTLSGIGDIASSYGQRPLIVTGRNSARAQRLFDLLADAKLNVDSLERSQASPPLTTSFEAPRRRVRPIAIS